MEKEGLEVRSPSEVRSDDVSGRKWLEAERDLTIELLDRLNATRNLDNLVRELIDLLYRWLKCDAIGVRLEMDGDYPYFETRGFPREFVLAERSLCSVDRGGEIVRDAVGAPVLECMCGNIICGRFDPAKPFFTEGGSFWSNCTTELLATTTDEDRQARTRNRCNGEGYESVVLVPLRFGDERFGLLQFNDKRKDLFSSEQIAFLEKAARYLSVALSHRRVEHQLKESEQRFRTVADFTYDWECWIAPDGHAIYVSPSCERITGFSPEKFLADPNFLESIVHPDDGDRYRTHNQGILTDRSIHTFDFRIVTRSGAECWIGHSSQPVYGADGSFLGVRCSHKDITDIKTAERELRNHTATKEILLREVNHRVKNNLTTIIGMVHRGEYRARQKGAVSILPFFKDLERQVRGLATLHTLLSDQDWRPLNLSRLCEELIGEAVKTMPDADNVRYEIYGSAVELNDHESHHLTLVINELTSNSVKHARTGLGPLRIEVAIDDKDDGIHLRFRDNGPGFSHEMLSGDFSDINTGFGLVFGIVRQILNGEVALSNEGGGVVTVVFRKPD
ncbi:MAG: PAS domain S-box protein [Proteobacteria bacterium]|nr:PAS domain S-box protein [Pseudomonadota bacterium]